MNARQILEKMAWYFGSSKLTDRSIMTCEGIDQALTALSTLLISELEKMYLSHKKGNIEFRTIHNKTLSDAIEKVKGVMR